MIVDLIVLVFFLIVLCWMITTKLTREEEEIDIALLIVRYCFQILRFFVAIVKASKKVKEVKAIGEIAIDDHNRDSDVIVDGLEGTTRPRSDSDYDGHRKQTNLII